MRRLRNANRNPDSIDVYYLSSAYRKASKKKDYPFSSKRQDARIARTQIMVENSNGHEIMNTKPAWGRV